MDYLVVIFPLVFVIGMVFVFTWLSRRRRKPKSPKTDHRTRQERGVWAWTTVTGATVGTVNTYGMARVELELQVHLPGSQPYAASTTWLVEESGLGYLEVGKEVSVKVDPSEPQYIYPNGSWAKIAGGE